MKSTTGAYGDFPDYYYEKGNQFGIYLTGQPRPKSWDDRHEHSVDGGHTVINLPGHAPKRSPQSLSERLTEVVRVALTPEGAQRLLTQLAQAHRLDLESRPSGDAKDQLRTFLLTRLSEGEQRLVLERLEAGAVAAYAAELEKRRRSRANRRRRSRNRGQRIRTSPVSNSATQRACAICGFRVSKSQAKACLADPLLMGHVYCVDHAVNIRRVLGR